MSRIFIKPAVNGHIIRHVDKLNYIIKQEGEWVLNNTKWKRLLLQGDIVIAEPPAPAKAAPEHKSEKPASKSKINKEGDQE